MSSLPCPDPRSCQGQREIPPKGRGRLCRGSLSPCTTAKCGLKFLTQTSSFKLGSALTVRVHAHGYPELEGLWPLCPDQARKGPWPGAPAHLIPTERETEARRARHTPGHMQQVLARGSHQVLPSPCSPCQQLCPPGPIMVWPGPRLALPLSQAGPCCLSGPLSMGRAQAHPGNHPQHPRSQPTGPRHRHDGPAQPQVLVFCQAAQFSDHHRVPVVLQSGSGRSKGQGQKPGPSHTPSHLSQPGTEPV